jgi:DNA primase
MLSRLVEEVVLAMDADSAGQEAMLRAQRKAAGRQMRLSVATMPEGVDPAEMLAGEGGTQRFRELLAGAVELPEFQVSLVLDSADVTSPRERDRALADAAPILAGMGESVSRAELVRRVAERLDLEPAMVMRRVVASRPREEGDGQAGFEEAEGGGRGATLTSRERRERALLAMCIAEPGSGRAYLERLGPEHVSAVAARALGWLRGHLEDPLARLPREDEELFSLITQLVMLAEREPASEEAMELNFLQLEQRRLEDRIEAAGKSGDYERRAELNRERAALVERIKHAERVG